MSDGAVSLVLGHSSPLYSNLMHTQPIQELGFKGDETEELPPRGYQQIKKRQKEGFIPGDRVWAGMWGWHKRTYTALTQVMHY